MLCLLTACAPRPEVATQTIHDPYEADNRKVHALNKAVDRRVIRPILGGGAVSNPVVQPVRRGVVNLGDTLDTPRRIVNNVLQGRVQDAVHNSFRLATNLTFGLGGLLDVSTEAGIEERDTDFGETLHVWGLGEGAYLELPLLGPSNERDTAGDVIDAAMNPLRFVLTGDALLASRAVRVGAKASDYSRASDTIADVLDTSADSYAIARQAWLQNRRFELRRNAERIRGGDGGFTSASAPVDAVGPYSETGAAAADGVDPYADPPTVAPASVDPYAETYPQSYTPPEPVPVVPVVDPYEEFDVE